MAETKPHVRVKLTIPGKVENQPDSARDAFWQQVRSLEAIPGGIRERSIPALEHRLVKEIPERLHQFMIESVSSPLTRGARALDEASDRHLWRDLDHWFMMRKEKEFFSSSDALSTLVQLAELRASQLRDIPNYSEILARISNASRVSISGRILRYGSIEFGLSFGNVDALRKAFDSDFESFQVFLEAFVPKSFDDLFSSIGCDFDIQHEESFISSFSTQKPVHDVVANKSTEQNDRPPTNKPSSDGLNRAEWLWKLANGSLLVPVMLMLAVLYFAIQETSRIGSMQAQAMKPIVEYYQNILTLQKTSASPNAATPAQKTSP